jgi:hypothetical protein
VSLEGRHKEFIGWKLKKKKKKERKEGEKKMKQCGFAVKGNDQQN